MNLRSTEAILHPVSDFIGKDRPICNAGSTYWYEGNCPQTGDRLQLPRTPLAEAIAHGLMQQLVNHEQYSQEGKMYGVLLVETASGEKRVLKAFSGLLQGTSTVAGWVPPISGREQVALEEARTLAILESIKQELIALQKMPERSQFITLTQEFETKWKQLSDCHAQRKHDRQHQRQQLLETLTDELLEIALEQLNQQSRQDGIERRQFKRQRDQAFQPFQELIEQADMRIRELKRQRKELSRQLQTQMYEQYQLTNFVGKTASLQQLMPARWLPTGTGDCCAPKLLHYAATQRLKPLAMAEFWWGMPSPNGDKIPGAFYGACAERCQPLMGFLLAGLKIPPPAVPPLQRGDGGDLLLEMIYEDEWIIAINKPAGLLSVPGRYGDRQDSVLNRLRLLFSNEIGFMPVHRLDQETSGLLLIARDRSTHRHLSDQFQQRQIHKIYEAMVTATVTTECCVIELPLWSDPSDRPYQKADWQRGKPSLTKFQVIAQEGNNTRIECLPITGRTHQIRVHAADARGLGAPILGDRLYGSGAPGDRLHLHAREVHFYHPQLEQPFHLSTETPF